MKHLLILFAVMLMALTATAQDNPSYVEVRGLSTYQRTIDRYQAVLEINTNSVGYHTNEDDKPKLEEIANRVFEKMEGLGFSKNKFKKNVKRDHFQPTSERAYYTFETSSEEEFNRFVTMKALNGTYITAKKAFLKPMENKEKLIAVALENARENAAQLARAMGKDLGDILSVMDYNAESKNDTYYPVPEDYTYGLSVRFTVK